MRMWTKRIDEEIHPNTTPITYAISHRHVVIARGPAAVEEFINKLGPAQADRRRRRIELGVEDDDAKAGFLVYDNFLTDMERALSESRWLVGDRFTLADACVIPFINRLDMLQLTPLWDPGRPHVCDWWDRVRARPMFEPMLYGFVPPELKSHMEEKGKEAWPKVDALMRSTA